MYSIYVICFFKIQVNIVIIRSNINSLYIKFFKGIYNSNYYVKF